MQKIIVTGILNIMFFVSFGQNIDEIINTTEVKRIEGILSSDEMQGRKIFTPGIERAARFIASEFRSAGLQPMDEDDDFRQEFAVKSGSTIAIATLNDVILGQENAKAYTSQAVLKIDQSSGYEFSKITPGDSFVDAVRSYMKARKNLIVLVDPSFGRNFREMDDINDLPVRSGYCKVFLLTETKPVTYSIEIKQTTASSKLCNIVGVLPGKSRKDEYVIFSAHYDHVGVRKSGGEDSIYNGANDDASGVTAVVMLARYFKELNNNERTLVFVAFTGEEYGMFGSRYFSKQLDPSKVNSMFNIEMIGTESKWGKNSAYITGYKRTSMGEILTRNLKGTGFQFYPDPYKSEQLFYRSDNISLATLGIPAHTIMTAAIDFEANYHRPSDEIGTLDIDNMTMVIKAIALSSRTIISGVDSPSRECCGLKIRY